MFSARSLSPCVTLFWGSEQGKSGGPICNTLGNNENHHFQEDIKIPPVFLNNQFPKQILAERSKLIHRKYFDTSSILFCGPAQTHFLWWGLAKVDSEGYMGVRYVSLCNHDDVRNGWCAVPVCVQCLIIFTCKHDSNNHVPLVSCDRCQRQV